ncbi:hypothetical protein JMJ77_0003273, partial [Colletotrichum scovillei]
MWMSVPSPLVYVSRQGDEDGVQSSLNGTEVTSRHSWKPCGHNL